jgi:DNA-binding beta-propeller fold protein YncE
MKNRTCFSKVTVVSLAGSGLAGFNNGRGAMASFSQPQGVAVDAKGNVFVADSQNNRIRKISSAGMVRTFAGDGRYGFRDGPRGTARFAYPTGIALD